MVSIELLPAAHGDALWIEYGTGARTHRILIDGGPAPAYEAGLRRRLAALPEGKRAFDLMVVTHIDADHIDGALILLQEYGALQFQIEEFWFNGWPQLVEDAAPPDAFAPLQGEFLGGIVTLDPALKRVWNRAFAGKAVVVPHTGALPEIALAGGAKLTLLGPAARDLRRLRARWASAIRDFSPGDATEAVNRLRQRRLYRPPPTPAIFGAPQYGDDRAVANGSSIACLFEYKGVALLLAGDAHARTLAGTLERLAQTRSVSRLALDAVKLPHHGSMSNVNESWLKWIDCTRWLISTNGDLYHHPDVETAQLIARHCSQPPTFYCNYRSGTTERLVQKSGQDDPPWDTVFPEQVNGDNGHQQGLKLVLPPDGNAGSPGSGTATAQKRTKRTSTKGAAT